MNGTDFQQLFCYLKGEKMSIVVMMCRTYLDFFLLERKLQNSTDQYNAIPQLENLT